MLLLGAVFGVILLVYVFVAGGEVWRSSLSNGPSSGSGCPPSSHPPHHAWSVRCVTAMLCGHVGDTLSHYGVSDEFVSGTLYFHRINHVIQPSPLHPPGWCGHGLAESVLHGFAARLCALSRLPLAPPDESFLDLFQSTVVAVSAKESDS
jgi:hypothetical protein